MLPGVSDQTRSSLAASDRTHAVTIATKRGVLGR